MANKKQFSILRKDVAVWNQWRIKHLDICPDLSRANLHYALQLHFKADQ